jgi:2',3'-cyclic-nucleotide 2'-phosphodiesterase (5'-nucleotidase family)
MISRLSQYFIAIAFLALQACSTPQQIVKSNRNEYNINNTIAVDSSIVKTYMPYKAKLEAEMNEVIGVAAVALTHRADVPESNLGNFFADAVANQAKKIVPNIDVVFPTTKGGLRNGIAKGNITRSAIFELMPFENELVIVELNGAAVQKMLQMIAATNGQPVAGLKMNIKDKMPENVLINGKPFDVTRTYRVLTSDYIANGGDSMQGFANPISRKNIGLLVRDALLKEVAEIQQAGKMINASLDGRITKN